MAEVGGGRPLVQIARNEWLWLVAVSLLVLTLFSIPYIAGLMASTDSMTFGGHLFALSDMHSYLAKMRYGARDGWLMPLVYTSEPHQGGFVFAFYMALGKLATLGAADPGRVDASVFTITYHIARVISGFALLIVLYVFVAVFLDRPGQRRLAWGLGALSGGVGWLPLILSPTSGWTPVTLYVPEAFSMLLLFGFPHLALARSLLLGGWVGLFAGLAHRGAAARWRVLLAAVCWLGMCLIVPFYGGALGLVIAGWLGVLLIVRRSIPWREFGWAALATAPTVVALIYYAVLFMTNPVFAQWSAQNQLHSPPLPDYLLAFGLLLIPAAIGLAVVIRRELTERTALLVAWPVVSAALVYMPINVQRRLLEGMIAPLAVLATLGLWRLVGERPADDHAARKWRIRQMGAGAYLGLMVPSLLLLIGGGTATTLGGAEPVFHSREERAALAWLQVNAPEDSIGLTTEESGNLLPAYAPMRVYLGHGPETLFAVDKGEEVRRLFAGEMSLTEQQALLAESQASYVWVGPRERELGADNLDVAALGLTVAFQDGDYVIYAVQGATP